MRLGGPTFNQYKDPATWVAGLKEAGYSAAFAPVGPEADDATVRAYVDAAAHAGIVIAEVGAWSNPISPNNDERRAARDKCIRHLAHAERIGARCCVNIAGARGPEWAGPHPDNLTDATFDLIVETTRHIIDAVKPRRTFYTLETMPWVFPDSADSYLRLLKAIDRRQFAVHFDPVNLINCPSRYFQTGAFLRDCFVKLGAHIKSCHAKDIALAGKLTVHLDEVRPGRGGLDYGVFLTELSRLDPDTPLMLEHLPSADEYAAAAQHIRQVATEKGLAFR
jgi:sugar phosphate isomerase/epimerase